MNKGWCLIPPSVFADSRLGDSEKMLFGKLLGLTNKTGYCWAGNEYLADMFGVSERSIQRRIKSLEKYDYITIEQNGHRFIRVKIEGDSSVTDGVTDLSLDTIDVHLQKENRKNKLFEDMLCKDVHAFWGEMRATNMTDYGLMERRRIPPLSTARRKAILHAHKSGYCEQDMREAISAVLSSDFHLENGYTDLTLILRDTKIEQYLALAASAQVADTNEPKELDV